MDESDNDNYKIIARLNENTLTVQCSNKIDSTTYKQYKTFIRNNTLAKDYYKDAYEFTEWFKGSGLQDLRYTDAIDTIIDENGNAQIAQVWNDDARIFQFNDNNSNGINIENELSSFNQHRLAVIRHKIEVNLAIAIANYNNFSGVQNVFQMPNLKENEWDYITHNISLISFLQGLPIGGKVYNGYSIVTNSESEEVVLEQNIYILGENDNGYEYCKIGDQRLNNGTTRINSGSYAEDDNVRSAGRINLDFKRDVLTDNTNTYYYYPIKDYNASYNSIIMQQNVDTYDDIYEYVNNCSDDLKKAFYTALGRERASLYKTLEETVYK